MLLVTRRRDNAGRRQCGFSLNAAKVHEKSPKKSMQNCCFSKLGMLKITSIATHTPLKYSHFRLFQFTTSKVCLMREQVDRRNVRFRAPMGAERGLFERFRAGE